MERRIVIHIGYHRTGTTWLQDIVFSKKELGFATPFSRKEINEEIIKKNALVFDPAVLREKFSSVIEKQDSQQTIIISHERLSGIPHAGGYDCKELADKLYQVFPTAKILIVIREQASMIRSSYCDYVKQGGACSLKDYIFPPHRSYRLPRFELSYFLYDQLISYYQKLFGKEKILVLPYELLVSNSNKYLRAIFQFCTLPTQPVNFPPINTSRSTLAIAIQRRLNPFIIRDSLNSYSPLALPGFIKITRFGFNLVSKIYPHDWHTPVIKKIIGNYYRLSNQQTAKITGLNLQQFGYDI